MGDDADNTSAAKGAAARRHCVAHKLVKDLSTLFHTDIEHAGDQLEEVEHDLEDLGIGPLVPVKGTSQVPHSNGAEKS
jgi:hypothetical protein